MHAVQANDELIPKEGAIKLAEHYAGGFLGTFVEATLQQGAWHIAARSSSAKPPVYYILHKTSGDLLLKLDNIDDPKQAKLLQQYLQGKLISKEQALDSAAQVGFLGTWTDEWIAKEGWHIYAWSKSATPGQYYIVDPVNGKILFHRNGSERLSQSEIDRELGQKTP